MKDINRVELRGRVGSIQFFGRDNNIASISIATGENYKDKNGEWKEVTTWLRVKAFPNNKNLPPLDTIEKGMIISVIGRIAVSKYKDRDGNERESVEIEATDIAIIDTERGANKGQGGNRGRNNDDQDF